MSYIKTRGPVIVLFIVGVLLITAYFIPKATVPAIGIIENELNSWGVLLSNFTYFVAAVSMLLLAITRIRHRSKDWVYSLWMVAIFFIFITVGLASGTNSKNYTNIYNNTVLPIGQAIWSLQSLLLIAALYTAFKLRTIESIIMMTAAVLSMLQNAPIGEALWSGFGPIGAWLANYPVTAGTRAFTITAAIGLIILGYRTLFGYESKSVGGG